MERILSGLETRTNLMVCNIPLKYTHKQVKEDFDCRHRNRYNQLNLPTDRHCPNPIEKINKGYAFINFRHVLYVHEFINDKTDYHWPRYGSEKKIEIKFATEQPSITDFNSTDYKMTE